VTTLRDKPSFWTVTSPQGTRIATETLDSTEVAAAVATLRAEAKALGYKAAKADFVAVGIPAGWYIPWPSGS
jgi:hypothetical protein